MQEAERVEREELQKLHAQKIRSQEPAAPSKTSINIEALLGEDVDIDLGNLFSTEGFDFELTPDEQGELEKRKQALKEHIRHVTKEGFGEAAKKIKEQQNNELAEQKRLQAKRARPEPTAGASAPASEALAVDASGPLHHELCVSDVIMRTHGVSRALMTHHNTVTAHAECGQYGHGARRILSHAVAVFCSLVVLC